MVLIWKIWGKGEDYDVEKQEGHDFLSKLQQGNQAVRIDIAKMSWDSEDTLIRVT